MLEVTQQSGHPPRTIWCRKTLEASAYPAGFSSYHFSLFQTLPSFLQVLHHIPISAKIKTVEFFHLIKKIKFKIFFNYEDKVILWSNSSYHFSIVLDFMKTAFLDVSCASYIHPPQQPYNMNHKPLVISAFLPQVLLLLMIQNLFWVSAFWRHLQYDHQYNTP